MDSDEPKALIQHFSVLKDVRDPTKCRHQLIDIFTIAIAAVLCVADVMVALVCSRRS
jgi:hypothetical protein